MMDRIEYLLRTRVPEACEDHWHQPLSPVEVKDGRTQHGHGKGTESSAVSGLCDCLKQLTKLGQRNQWPTELVESAELLGS